MSKSYDEIKQERQAENERLYGNIRDSVERNYNQVINPQQQGLMDMMTKQFATDMGYGAARLKQHVQERKAGNSRE